MEKSAKKAEDNGLRYEFYTVLPESEIVIPEQELLQRERSKPAAQQKKHAYILQAGSFRKKQQAETLKARLALLGAREGAGLPVVVTVTFNRTPRGYFTMMGDTVERVADTLAANGATGLGANCTLSSEEMVGLAKMFLEQASLPLLFQPNVSNDTMPCAFQVIFTH